LGIGFGWPGKRKRQHKAGGLLLPQAAGDQARPAGADGPPPIGCGSLRMIISLKAARSLRIDAIPGSSRILL
jgi:hypothetical protein